ncbi:MAG: DNA gyrase C-terminal beta-propeller domain-containing protein, partial [Oscillospiraceae bacterium]
HFGYIKRQPMDVYKLQKRGGRGVSGMKHRDEDFVEELFISSTHENVLFITTKGKMYKLKCYEIPEGSKSSIGMNIVNILPLSEGEKVAAMLKTSDFDEGRFIIMVTKNGKIKRTPLSAYKNVRKNGLIAIGLDEGDEIAGVRLTDGNCEIMVATHEGRAIRMNENQMRSLSRAAHGVRAIKLRDGDFVVSMARIREGATVLTVTERGLGRRCEIESYPLRNRGGYGVLNYKVSDEKGYVCGIKVVDEQDDIIMIANDGVIIRIRACDVRVMGRYSTGVRLMRVNGEETKVVTFTRAEHEDDVEIAEVEQPSDEEIAKELELEKLEAEKELSEPDAVAEEPEETIE